jgi:hypothetical protein
MFQVGKRRGKGSRDCRVEWSSPDDEDPERDQPRSNLERQAGNVLMRD